MLNTRYELVEEEIRQIRERVLSHECINDQAEQLFDAVRTRRVNMRELGSEFDEREKKAFGNLRDDKLVA